MLSKNDCLALLVKLEDSGVKVDQYIKELLISKDVPLDVLKFITKNKGLDIGNFYEMLRKKHNQKKSPLYTNILKEEKGEEDIVTTLACLLVQIILYSNKLLNKDAFIKESRAEEITRALNSYYREEDITLAAKVLNLVRSDLLVLEAAGDRRNIKI